MLSQGIINKPFKNKEEILDIPINHIFNKLNSEWKLPGKHAEQITIKHLLTHTGGISIGGFGGYDVHYKGNFPSTVDVLRGNSKIDELSFTKKIDELLKSENKENFMEKVYEAAQEKMKDVDVNNEVNSAPIESTYEPGKWKYSGGGYTVLQYLIEELNAKPFEKFIEDTVVNELGLKNTTFKQSEVRENTSYGHYSKDVKDGKGNNVEGPVDGKVKKHPEMAAAGIRTTASDLAKYTLDLQKAIINNPDDPPKYFSKNVAQLQIQGDISTGTGESKMGLGFFTSNIKNSEHFIILVKLADLFPWC